MSRIPKRYRVEINGTQLTALSLESGVHLDDDQQPAPIDDHQRLRSFVARRSNGASTPIYVEDGEGEHDFMVYLAGEAVHVHVTTPHDERLLALRKNTAHAHSAAQIVSAPMPGLLKEILVAVGDHVSKSASLCILEAMKMENEIKSPGEFVVKRLIATPGTAVEKGSPLIELAPVESN